MKRRLLRGAALLLTALIFATGFGSLAGCSITEIVTSMQAEGDSTFMFADSGSMYLWGDSSLCGGESTAGGTVFDYVPGVVDMAFGDGFALWLTREGIVVSGNPACLPLTDAPESVPPTLLCTLNSTGLDSSFAEHYALVAIDLSEARQVAAAGQTGLVLLSDGRLIELSGSGLVELTEIGLLTRVSAAPTGERAGVRADGSVVLWGGSFGAPTEYTNAVFTQAESAGEFVLALDEEGDVWRLDGETANHYDGDYVSLSAGDGFAIAVSRLGELCGWGTGDHGRLGGEDRMNGEILDIGISGVIAVSCGRAHAVALRKDGTLWAWGAGGSGQLGAGSADSPVALKLPEKTAKVDIR